MQASIPSPPNDAFWDKRNNESSAAIRGKLLQPAGPSAPGPSAVASASLGHSPSANQPGPSSDGNVDQSPFGLVGNPPPEDPSVTSNHSQNAQVSHLSTCMYSFYASWWSSRTQTIIVAFKTCLCRRVIYFRCSM